MKKSESRILGDYFEDYAVKMLKKDGYKIIERNIEIHPYEIDIIAKKTHFLVFIEVKSRGLKTIYDPLASIDTKKIMNIKLAARQYVSKQREMGKNMDKYTIRFDGISIRFDEDKKIIDYKHKIDLFKDKYYEIF